MNEFYSLYCFAIDDYGASAIVNMYCIIIIIIIIIIIFMGCIGLLLLSM